ncbi:MAG: hypothetical protein C5B58_12395 [Acidobacteria bacterium]|nr:MAG: hypothetical protein C5B58_12395 [Acidobacteriota bacterium]
MSNSTLPTLRSILKTLDDEALAALANKGLLRRAMKDLETSRPAVIAADADTVQLQVGDEIVRVPKSPAQSTCTCPATGICRHVLSALVYLRDDAALAAADSPVQTTLFTEQAMSTDGAVQPQDATPVCLPSAEEALGSLSDEVLQKWAGKANFQRALRLLAEHLETEIDTGPPLVVRLPTRNVTCRWIPSGGPEGMTCSCRSQAVCDHVIAALLAYQVFLGRRQIAAHTRALHESSGAPRTRAEVLGSVGTVLRELITLGLARHSAASVARLTTLAISAHGVDLPRLERMLKALADEIQLLLRRNAQSSSDNLLLAAARCEALRMGLLARPTAALVGQHRTTYQEVGQITLTGLGAQHWQSKGGYRGVTVYFWDQSRGAFATWSESRPIDQLHFNPKTRFQSEGPWSGCGSPREASQSVLRLSGAFRNPHGRVSGRPSTGALVLGPTLIGQVPKAITDWSEIASRCRRLFGSGLSENSENLQLAILLPDRWLPATYDPVRQELTRPILDQRGRSIQLWLPFTAENESAIEYLERHDPASTRGLLGSIRFVSGRVLIQPISLFLEDRVVSVNLDSAETKPTAANAPDGAGDEEQDLGGLDPLDDQADAGVAVAGTTAIGRLLMAAQAEIESIAESGTGLRRDLGLLSGTAGRFEALGLATCAKPLAQLVQLLTRSAGDLGTRDEAAGRLLWSYYLLQLAATQETIATACSAFS